MKRSPTSRPAGPDERAVRAACPTAKLEFRPPGWQMCRVVVPGKGGSIIAATAWDASVAKAWRMARKILGA